MDVTTPSPSGDQLFQIPEFLKHGRENPINGAECFFTETSFQRVVGQEPSFKDRLMLQISRAKRKNVKKSKKYKDVDMPTVKTLDKKKANSDQPAIEASQMKSEKPTDVPDIMKCILFPSNVSNKDSESDGEDSLSLVIADDMDSVDKKATDVSSLCVSENEVKEITQTETNKEENDSINNHSHTPQRMEGIKLPGDNDNDNSYLQIVKIPSPEKCTLHIYSDLDVTSKAPRIDEGVSCTSSGITESYAVGASLLNISRHSTSTTKSQDNESMTTGQSQLTADSTSQAAAIEEEVCLVMPPLDSDDEDCNNADETACSTSSLPLIPALMSNSVKADKQPQPIEKLITTPSISTLFYSTEQTSTEIVPSSSKSQHLPEAYSQSIALEDVKDIQQKEDDIPIFCVKSTPSPEKKIGKNRGIWTNQDNVTKDGTKEKTMVQDTTVKEVMKFRQSDLTREEMATYLQLYAKYVKPYLYGGSRPILTHKQTEEMEVFEALEQRVLKEQRDVQAYLQQNAIKNPRFYEFIRKEGKNYAMQKAQNYRPSAKLVKFFTPGIATKIPFRQDFNNIDFKFHQTLLELGHQPKITLPDIKSVDDPVAIPLDMKKLGIYFPQYQRTRAPGMIHHEAVGQDINASVLAIKYESQIVLSSSVIKCLMNNRGPNYTQSWNIPVTVKEHKLENGRTHKVIYLNKPLFEKKIMRDYNALLNKYMFRVMVSHPKQVLTKRKPNVNERVGPKRKGRAADDPFDLFATDLGSLETFGKTAGGSSKVLGLSSPGSTSTPTPVTGSPGVRKSNRIANAMEEKTQTGAQPISESSSGSSLQEADLEVSNKTPQPKSMTLRKRTVQQVTSSDEAIDSEEGLSPSLAKKATLSKSETSQSLSQDQLSAHKTEAASSEFSSGRKKRVVPLTAKSEPPKAQPSQFSFMHPAPAQGNSLLDLILGPDVAAAKKKDTPPQENPEDYEPHSDVMCSLVYALWTLGQHRVIMRTRSPGTYKNKNIYMTTKMEYQSGHGLEQVTAEEKIRDWCACYFRPGTSLLRARVNAFKSEILMYEELDTHQILKPASDFRPEDGFSFLNGLFNHLQTLSSGNYLLSHEPGNDFCGVKLCKHDAGAGELMFTAASEQTSAVVIQSKVVPWIPLDTSLQLPFQRHFQRIPATFLPKDVALPQPGVKKPKHDNKDLANMYEKRKKKQKKNPFQKKKIKERDFF